MASIYELLEEVIRLDATDLHLTPGLPPEFRVSQQLVPYEDSTLLTPESCKELVYCVLTAEQKKRLETHEEVDFAFSVDKLSRFRGNAFWERGNVACALRRIPFEIPTMRELGLPLIAESLVQKTRGLILVSGPTGSGKSTTLAAMIDKINTERACHIITIEDPIEYIHTHKKGLIQQRELGQDTQSFALALKYALRQDPDAILVGEMRDLETIGAALTAAETGHIVLSTLHTDSATESINRIIDVFPAYQQHQVRSQLALTLEGVLVQRLLPKASGRGLCLAMEIMIATSAIRAIIRDNRVHEIYGTIQASQKSGMQTMNMSLLAQVKRGVLSWRTAMIASPIPEELQRMKDKETNE
ncbi:MAG: type IV pilus twitching motility protein PilT [Candidatus Stahlbacteria bacterium]|nr:type IV pilus twitching motility protein PilT [Candidatus Stahlbacteria bacterium]